MMLKKLLILFSTELYEKISLNCEGKETI